MTELSTDDEKYLRRAIALADAAVDSGNRPFGALVVDGDGTVVAEGYSTQQSDRDWTAHAEMNVLRAAGRTVSWEANVRRLVFGLGEASMRPLRSGNPQGRGLAMSCRDVLSTSAHPIEVIGPALEEEPIEPHRRFSQIRPPSD